MAQTERPGLSVEQKRELWRRWKEGESLSEIGRALERGPGSIFGVVIPEGAGSVSRAFCSFFRHDGGDRAPIGGPFLLSAGARRRGVGVKVERPQAKPRTNDLDAGEERRRLLQEEAAVRPSRRSFVVGQGRTGVPSPGPESARGGQPESSGAGHPFAATRRAWSGAATARWAQSSGRPRRLGVMTSGEHARWLRPSVLTPPRPGNGSRRRAGRSRRA